jgi:hypothetical protein
MRTIAHSLSIPAPTISSFGGKDWS